MFKSKEGYILGIDTNYLYLALGAFIFWILPIMFLMFITSPRHNNYTVECEEGCYKGQALNVYMNERGTRIETSYDEFLEYSSTIKCTAIRGESRLLTQKETGGGIFN